MFYLVFIFLASLFLIYIAGPRVRIPSFPKRLELPEIDKLDEYIALHESHFDDLQSHAKAEIVWHEGIAKTKYSILYLHGFTATKMETQPLAKNLASRLCANIFYARLSGHGRGYEALNEPDAGDWLFDSKEAMEIAKRIGERVIVIGTSTGGTLAAYLAEEYDDDTIYIMISPNFGPRDKRAELLLLPWGRTIARIVSGKSRGWKVQNQEHERCWTCKYPTNALLPMMALVKFIREMDFIKLANPIMIFYSEKDNVVDPALTIEIYKAIGSKQKQIVQIKDSQDADNHVLAGDILSPNTTNRVEKNILNFIDSLEKVS